MSDGEFSRIARLRSRFRGPPPPAVGIGDDAALVSVGGVSLAITVDASVEGVHFRRGWAPLDALAARAAQAALSDLAAKSADPSRAGGGLLFALELPSSLDEPGFDALIEGLARAAESHGAPVLGGNLCRSPSDAISITTTALGVARASPLRAGARAGDGVYVTGFVGAARLGVEALLAGRADEPPLRPFVQRWLAPRAHIREGLALAERASAAIDVSDGLAQDAGHLAEASGVAIVFDSAALPLAAGHHDAARALGLDPLSVALSGGEEYVLLFTAPDGLAPRWATRVGLARAGRGVFVRDGDGERPARGGWDHFR